ncbi:MAG: DUF2089 domain-containing protein [Spirochaetales bacterium]|nr:DUF2089 domain-containing protein [Spirochaetales bacterium]
MKQKWSDLHQLVGNQPMRVERVRMEQTGIAIEGSFSLPPLAQLSEDDQIFIAAFLATHGSIKKMESIFRISYPTVKNRLNQIVEKLDVPRMSSMNDAKVPAEKPLSMGILEQLERGEVTVDQILGGSS